MRRLTNTNKREGRDKNTDLLSCSSSSRSLRAPVRSAKRSRPECYKMSPEWAAGFLFGLLAALAVLAAWPLSICTTRNISHNSAARIGRHAKSNRNNNDSMNREISSAVGREIKAPAKHPDSSWPAANSLCAALRLASPELGRQIRLCNCSELFVRVSRVGSNRFARVPQNMEIFISSRGGGGRFASAARRHRCRQLIRPMSGRASWRQM